MVISNFSMSYYSIENTPTPDEPCQKCIDEKSKENVVADKKLDKLDLLNRFSFQMPFFNLKINILLLVFLNLNDISVLIFFLCN